MLQLISYKLLFLNNHKTLNLIIFSFKFYSLFSQIILLIIFTIYVLNDIIDLIIILGRTSAFKARQY